MASAAETMSGSGLLFCTSSEVVQRIGEGLTVDEVEEGLDVLGLAELARTSREPRP